MRAKMATMSIWIRRKNHHNPVMDQVRVWRTESIVLDSVKTGQYISDL
jgi:hypothetical protein